jgi:hypothetical protein
VNRDTASWKTARRVVAKVEHHAGESFPRVGFIVTNLTLPCRAVVRFCNKRGTAEQWTKEGKPAVKMTRLSCHRFRSNEGRLWLSVIAYNLGNLWRRLVLPKRIDKWSLTSLQQRLVKTGGRLVKHAQYYWLLLAESHLTSRLFGAILRHIQLLSMPAGRVHYRLPETPRGTRRAMARCPRNPWGNRFNGPPDRVPTARGDCRTASWGLGCEIVVDSRPMRRTIR